MLYPFKRLKSLTHRQCTYAVIRTEPAKGQWRKKIPISCARGSISFPRDAIPWERENISCARAELFSACPFGGSVVTPDQWCQREMLMEATADR